MQPPDRVTVPTCIGCGAMSEFGTCEDGCTEQRLELVPADQYEHLTAFTASARIRADAFRTVAVELASRQPGADECEAAYRSVQEIARISLRRYPPLDAHVVDWDEPLEHATTWWCAGCGGIDAPQPCLGICVWRRVEWVNAVVYNQERQRALAERDAEGQLRRLLQHLASITPRQGHWQRGWEALEARGRQAHPARAEPRSSREDAEPGTRLRVPGAERSGRGRRGS